MTAAIALVCASLAWVNLSSMRDLDARAALASAIVATDATDHEALLLMRIARFESAWSPAVYRCARWTTPGGAFQVATSRKLACGPLDGQARLALHHVRASLAACAWLPAHWRLSQYTRGSCTSRRGRELSRVRWVSP